MGAKSHAGAAVRFFLATIERENARHSVERNHQVRYALIDPGSHSDGNLTMRHRRNYYPRGVPSSSASSGFLDRAVSTRDQDGP